MQKKSRNVKWLFSTTASFDPPFGFMVKSTKMKMHTVLYLL